MFKQKGLTLALETSELQISVYYPTLSRMNYLAYIYHLYIYINNLNCLILALLEDCFVYSLQLTRTVYFPSKNKLKQKIISSKIQVKGLHQIWDGFDFCRRKFILES